MTKPKNVSDMIDETLKLLTEQNGNVHDCAYLTIRLLVLRDAASRIGADPRLAKAPKVQP